ncbi:gamma carbonic anhydrase family protein [Sphingomonas bacterium]|uniref:gamma carbonic anhydrase family protein n=1 Tax=Sphingomonas bacterium TaxID=1895847 RepID=UPI001575E636|nr:gamma carbonic anhydrase family protein [Sphingomonas bacterium]
MPLYALDGQSPTLAEDGSAWIAPSAELIGDVRLGEDASVWFGAVIRADNTPILVGPGTNVQEGAMLHSDPHAPLTIGSGVTIGHHAILHGCTIGDDTLIGMGATILNEAVIGAECIVAAGALVTERKTFPPRSMIMGAPAKVVRALEDAEVAAIRASAKSYAGRAQGYAAGLRRCD